MTASMGLASLAGTTQVLEFMVTDAAEPLLIKAPVALKKLQYGQEK
jgi:hypothetical protein